MTQNDEPDSVMHEGLPLRLSFSPAAIREHFEDDEPNPLDGLTDEDLVRVGGIALMDDALYEAFHHSLDAALSYYREHLHPREVQ